MPRGGGPAGQRGRAMAAQMGAPAAPLEEISPEVWAWWQAIQAGADGAEVDEASVRRSCVTWDSHRVQQAFRLLEVGSAAGQVRGEIARIIQSGLRATQAAIFSGQMLAKIPDSISLAYVQVEHILDPQWGSDDFRDRLKAPHRLSEVEIEIATDGTDGLPS